MTRVFALALLFVVVPFVELYVILQVGHAIGVLNTLVLLLLVSITGAWLVKREGMGVLRRAQLQMQAGRVPGTELIDGALILFAGALLLTPGFVSDIVGVLLLLPPVRFALRGVARRRLASRIAIDRRGWCRAPRSRLVTRRRSCSCVTATTVSRCSCSGGI